MYIYKLVFLCNVHILFQLSEVEGGASVFPNLGRFVYPKLGSVLFWYNVHSDGYRNEDALHGSCPALLGTRIGRL